MTPDARPDAVRAAADVEPSALPPLVAADLEGTCTAGETWRGTGRWLAAHGRRGRYRRFLAPRLAAVPLVRLGLVDRHVFRERWIRDLARLLDGLSAAQLDDLARFVVEDELWPKRRPAVLAELETAAAEGRRVVVASGSYQPVVAAFVGRLGGGPAGPPVGLGTPLAVDDGRTTGRLGGPIGTGPRKADRVRALAAGAEIMVAYGDSRADVPLLEIAGTAVAVAPDADLRPIALERGWRILDAPPADAGASRGPAVPPGGRARQDASEEAR